MIKLFFGIEPVPQLRPRATKVRKNNRYTGQVRVYDLPKVSAFKKYMKNEALVNMIGKEILDGPISLKIKFYRSIQKSGSKKEYDMKAKGEIRPTVKPDLSNYLKAAEDALNGVVWKDDALIVHTEMDKLYSEEPRIEVEVDKWSKE